MSTTAIKRTWREAMADAIAFRDLFPSTCYERWEVAGSLRRRVAEVGDVEHVVIPRVGQQRDGLFGEPKPVNLLWHHLDAMLHGGAVSKHLYGTAGTRWGPKYRGSEYRGRCHEIWTADADNFGAQLAIRTGPGDFSRRLVTSLQGHGYVNDGGYVWDKSAVTCPCGWSGTFVGLLRVRPGEAPEALWTNGEGEPVVCPGCRRGDRLGMTRVSVPGEQQYFALCGMRWIPPEARR